MTSEWAPPGSTDDAETGDAPLLQQMSTLRRRIDELPTNDFAARYALETQIDEIRVRLDDANADALAEAADEWSARAGRKGEHEQNVAALEAMARIMTGDATGA